jgi:hypothetical protein
MLMVASPFNADAQNAGAERYKIPVEANIQPKHDLGLDQVGNVVVTYADGTTDLWTLKGNCKLPKISSQGAVGWVICETQPNSNALKLYDGMAIGSRLAVNFRGRIVANLRSAKPFIEDWAFERDGQHVVVKSRLAHGSAVIERFALRDGPPEAAVEAYRENLPDWAQVFAEASPEGQNTSEVSGQGADKDEENDYENAVAQGTRIIKTKIIPQYETKDGFNVKPMGIKYYDDPAIAKLEERYGGIQKRFYPVVANTYAEIERRINEGTRPEAAKYRNLLTGAFHEAIRLRGGGSASAELYTFIPAQQEWMIAHLGASGAENVQDGEFVFRLTKALTVGESPQHSEVLRVLDKLKAIERFLDKNDAAFLRAEFVSYFKGN